MKRASEDLSLSDKRPLDDPESLEEQVLSYQKKAIWVQMQEYKRLYEDSNMSIQQLETRLKQSEECNQFLSSFIVSIKSLFPSSSGNHSFATIFKQIPSTLDMESELRALQASVEAFVKSDDVHVTLQTYAAQNAALTNQLERLGDELKELSEKNHDKESRIMSLERKLDRSRLEKRVVQVVETPVEKKVEDVSGIAEEKYMEAVKTAQFRLGEIDQLKSERIAMQQEITRLRSQLEDQKIAHGSTALSSMENRLSTSDMEISRLKSDLALKMGEILRQSKDYREFVDTIKSLDSKERKEMSETIKKLNHDLTRIRSTRDSLQKALDAKTSKADSRDVLELLKTRNDRIKTLEEDVRRLKMCIAASMGEKGLLEFFEVSDENPYKKLSLELAECKAKLQAYEKNETIDTLAEENARLKQTPSGDVDVATLQVKLDYYQKTEAGLMQEIETIGKAWTELEAQVSKKVLDVSSKDETIHRLQADKSKYEQKFTSLSKQNAALNQTVSALKKQSDKLLQQIRKLEELEKNANQQIQMYEQRSLEQIPLIEKEKELNYKLQCECEVLKNKLEIANQTCNQLSSNLSMQVESIEFEASEKRRAYEQLEVMKRKVEYLQKKDGPGDPMMEKQLEEYKLLLKCQSCNTDFKSHVLLKCMHTFCKGCIDDMYNSRQRKCPTCGVAFGIQDVKPIYL